MITGKSNRGPNGFEEDIAQKLSKNAKLRNILAYEYLDIRYKQIKDFLNEPDRIYNYLAEYTQKYFSDTSSQSNSQ